MALNIGYLALILSFASAADKNAPYIDRLKQGIPPKENTGSLIEEVRRKKGVITDNQDEYIRRLKEGLEPPKEGSEEGFLERERARLGESQSQGGAIQAVLDGKSKLKSRREGKVTAAAGFRIGASMTHGVVASPDFQRRPYEEIYGSSTIPAFEFFYEFQPFRSEIFGNIGIFTSLGTKVARGMGKFKSVLAKPPCVVGNCSGASGVFPSESRTQFSFVTIPITAGISYRFHLLKYLRPYGVVGFGGVPWAEMRSDAQSGNRGFSRVMNINLGVAILLDWMNESSAFDLYDTFGVKHSYLSVDYIKRTNLGGNVRFDTSGVLVGMTFEY